ncbi:MAG: transglutaminase domain-containing protein [Dehalococcoidia bacterium]|nr:transglutaminase domain-containing protein [Dehalococcoidia bacterium]
MMINSGLEKLYRPSDHDRYRQPNSLLEQFRRGISWFSIFLLLIALLAMTRSLENANWVDEMPSIYMSALIGFSAGLITVIFQVKHYTRSLHIGAITTIVLSLSTIVWNLKITDPTTTNRPYSHLNEFFFRIYDWYSALITGGISNDPLPFVIILILTVSLVSFYAVLSTIRWKNPWLALLPSGFILLTNISYLSYSKNFELMIFLFIAILLIIQINFSRSLEKWHVEHRPWPEHISIQIIFLGIVTSFTLVTFAWLTPTFNNWKPVDTYFENLTSPLQERFEWSNRIFAGISSKRDLPVHSFGETMPLQASISLSNTELMEIETISPGNFKAAVYDEYTGFGWRLSDTILVDSDGTTLDAALFGTPLTQSQLREPRSLTVTVLNSIPNRRLLFHGEPLAADIKTKNIINVQSNDIVGVTPKDRLKPAMTYTTVGAISIAPIQSILSTSLDYPSQIKTHYLQLPSNLPMKVKVLAEEITNTTEHPYISTRKIEDYLRRNYPYTLDINRPPARADVIENFLFTERRGYFDHHASSMAILLRTIGIPSRIATGFTIDSNSFDTSSKSYKISEVNSWSWPEVYFPGLGWIEFNPTPNRPLILRTNQPNWSPDSLALSTDILPFEDDDDDELLDELNNSNPFGDSNLIDPTENNILSVRNILQILILCAIAGFTLITITFIIWGIWIYLFRKIPSNQRYWAKIQHLAKWAGLPIITTQTPSEWSELISKSIGNAYHLRVLANDYNEIRFGNPSTIYKFNETTLTASYKEIKKILIHRILTMPVLKLRNLLPFINTK